MRSYFFAALAATAATSAFALPIVPAADSWGVLAAATFGGSGIPNDDVGISHIANGLNSITLGLTAHQRYSNPALGSDGNGTFTATPGANYGNPSGPPLSPYLGATWNFGFYVNLAGVSNFGNQGVYTVSLLVDINPGAGTDEASHLAFNIPLIGSVTGAGITVEDSSNLGFIPGFNPNAVGEYTFALIAKAGSVEIGRSAMQVNVQNAQSVPDSGSMAMLLATGMGSLVWLGSRRGLSK